MSDAPNGLMSAEPNAERLTDPWMLGPLHVPNRVMLAPLAGIGNWFVRLQAKRYGAGMAVSEMVSSHAIHYRNEKTCNEMLRIDPRERHSGPVSIQLFGDDPAIMHAAAAHVAAIGADAIDINMGCPVAKVQKAGAGAALLADPDRAVELALAAVQGARDGARGAVHGARDGARAGGRSVCGPPSPSSCAPGCAPAMRVASSSRTASSRRPASPPSPSIPAPHPSSTRGAPTTSSPAVSSARCPHPSSSPAGSAMPSMCATPSFTPAPPP